MFDFDELPSDMSTRPTAHWVTSQGSFDLVLGNSAHGHVRNLTCDANAQSTRSDARYPWDEYFVFWCGSYRYVFLNLRVYILVLNDNLFSLDTVYIQKIRQVYVDNLRSSLSTSSRVL